MYVGPRCGTTLFLEPPVASPLLKITVGRKCSCNIECVMSSSGKWQVSIGWSVDVLCQHLPRTVLFSTRPFDINTQLKAKHDLTSCLAETSITNTIVPPRSLGLLRQRTFPPNSSSSRGVVPPGHTCHLALVCEARAIGWVTTESVSAIFVAPAHATWAFSATLLTSSALVSSSKYPQYPPSCAGTPSIPPCQPKE